MDSKRHRTAPNAGAPSAHTIYDVARYAGVGIGTVSRVLNGHINVSSATRERVQAAIRELDYSPDPIARSLNSGRTATLGIIVPFFTRPFAGAVLEGVQAEADAHGYDLVLYNMVRREQRDMYYNKLPMRRRVDGLICVSIPPDDAEAHNILRQKIPTILVDCYNAYLTSIVVDNVTGAYDAIAHLIRQGRRRIGFINGVVEGSMRFNQATDRLTGYLNAHRDAGLPVDPQLIVYSEWNRPAARAAVHPLFAAGDLRPDAIFAASDLMAVGVQEEALAMGLRVPEDVALVGFDGTELSDIMNISTVQQPMTEMGRMGVQLLLENLAADVRPAPQTITFKPELIVRRTSIES